MRPARSTPARLRSGTEGVLMAVINEDVSDSVHQHWMEELAYIRGASGREFTTAVDNVEPAEWPSASADGHSPPSLRSA
ncbi:hypothetical protein WKI68_15995 [Streptomyces sp. MS1.HAVA.3]|uniref:Uncharacterized protein n=1 Tax=Streptomyces caledonius TaxID=3134107 RepID=A0ABU8U3P7_9ACTN